MDNQPCTLTGVEWPEAQRELRARMKALPRGEKKKLHEALGVTDMYLSHIIANRRPLTAERAALVAEFLGLRLDIQFPPR